MSGLRRQSETESAGDTDHVMEDIADPDVEGVAAGGGEGGRLGSGLRGDSIGTESDFLTLPSFSRYIPNSALNFNEFDLILKNGPEKKFIQNLSPIYLLQHSLGGLVGNVYLPRVCEIPLPPWNLNFSQKFPGTICVWDINKAVPSKLELMTSFPLPTTSFIDQDCMCVNGPRKSSHAFKMTSSSIIIIGDEFVPPRLGCMSGNCPLILRTPCTGSLDETLDFVKKIFSRGGKYSTNPPLGSIFFISMNSCLTRATTQAFVCMLFDFINRFGAHLERTFGRKYLIFPLVLPVSDIFKDMDLAGKVTDILEAFLTMKGQIDEQSGRIFAAGIDWYLEQGRISIDESSCKTELSTMMTTELFFPSCSYSGFEKSFYSKGGDSIKVARQLPQAPGFPSAISADYEALLWNKFGTILKSNGLHFPDLEEISLQFTMANRINDNRSFFTRFVAVTPTSEAGVILIGNSIAKSISAALSTDHGFKNIERYEIRDPSLSSEYLDSLGEAIRTKSKVIETGATLVFVGFGNSLLKARSDLELKVISGTPIHIYGQVSQISDQEFQSKLENVTSFVSKLGLKSIIIPPLPRHFSRCCVDMYHFDRDFDGSDFVSDIRDWGIFMAQSKSIRPLDQTPILASIFGCDLFQSSLTGKDGVHLKEIHLKRLNNSISELVRSGDAGTTAPYVLPASIPADISLASWKLAFRIKFKNDFPEVVITSQPQALVPAGGKIMSVGARGRGAGNRRKPYSNRFNPSRGRGPHAGPFPPHRSHMPPPAM